MTYSTLLINTCTIRRWVTTGTDGYGIPSGSWNVLHDGEPCRHVTGKGREIKVGAEVHIAYDQLFLNDIDITPQDRAEVDGETYEILDVAFRQDAVNGHHKHAYLEIVR